MNYKTFLIFLKLKNFPKRKILLKIYQKKYYFPLQKLAFCNKYHYEVSWSIFDQNTLNELKDYIGSLVVLSIGSGQAFNELLMQLSGINIISTDNYESYGKNSVYYKKVLDDSSEAIKKNPSDILYLSWPIKDIPMATDSLKLFKGNKLIYVGDIRITADKAFYKLLDKKWKVVKTIKLTQWNGIKDIILIYEKK